MTSTALAGRAPRGEGCAGHLIHRPRTWEHHGIPAAEDAHEEFVLVTELPAAPLLAGAGTEPARGGAARFHGVRAVSEAIRAAGEVIGFQYFAVPAHRTGLFYRFGIDVPDISAWRIRADEDRSHPDDGARLTAALTVRPGKVVGGVPRALEFRAALEIDDEPCGTASAHMIFLPPVLHRTHREHSRATALAATEGTGSTGSTDGAGSADGANGSAGDGRADGAVRDANGRPSHQSPLYDLLHDAVVSPHGRLSTAVRPPEAVPGAVAGRTGATDAAGGHAAPYVLTEAVRQTAVLTAQHTYRMDPQRCAPGALDLHFRGYAEPDLGLRCAAVAGPQGRDGQGRRQTAVTLALSQAGRTVLEAVVRVVEDH